MFFKQELMTKGIKEDDSNVFLVENGTFFDNDRLPSFGYNENNELRDDKLRGEYDLEASKGMASRSDLRELRNGKSGVDGSRIKFEMVISSEVDQIAIAPGSLVSDRVEGDRRYFHYKEDEPTINFYSIVSARYEVARDYWNNSYVESSPDIDLEIYYHNGHAYNVGRMIHSMKASLGYFSEHFSPYRHHVLRIAEYPRYRKFAQSFSATIPFSEALGFILAIDDFLDVDIPFYITAHEVSHQWWGLYLVAANVQGKNFILETLAQYSALMVLKSEFGEVKAQQFLAIQKEQYDEKRRGDGSSEKTLVLVEREEYLYYSKGALAMYELQASIGEGSVNRALQRFLKDWNMVDGELSTDRFPTTSDLMEYFKQEAPELQRIIVKELFEEVWNVENKNEI